MQSDSQSVVALWNEQQLEAIREGVAKPTQTTYELHLASSAIYDAYAAISSDASGQYSDIATSLEDTHENKAEAVSFAAFTALSQLYPQKSEDFAAFLEELGYDPDTISDDPDTPAGLGRLAAQNVFTARENDGSNAENGFADTTGYVPVNDPDPTSDRAPGGDDFDPNQWQPLRVPNGTLTDENGVPISDNNDPSTFDDQQALTPHWGDVDSFALESPDQFRPVAPPQLGDTSPYTDGLGNVTTNDQAYRDQTDAVLEASANLTNEQKVVAEFWADGPRTESPPGHWNQLAQDLALRDGHGIDEDAEMFFALNAAVFDAGIATWEAKYEYNYVRPQSAIRDLYFDQEIEAWGGPNEGTQTILGQEWQPYQNVTFVTPPFPEFVSGHSTFSMAAARTLASYLGSDAFYDGETLGNYDLDGVEGTDLLGEFVTSDLIFEDFGDGPPIVLRWETLTEAAEEAGISRIYGGIHIQDGNLRGLEVGEDVAANAEVRWSALFSNGGDDVIVGDAEDETLLGGSGDDVLFGADGNDVLDGDAGNDVLFGGGGNDLMSGGDGEDRLFGVTGDDTIDGGAGIDRINGGDGDDVLSGGDGGDAIFGNAGNDEISGDAGDDLAFGGEGNDTMDGGDGDDVMFGVTGDDVMNGGAGVDRMAGGDGNDEISGGLDGDALFGADGDDILSGNGGDDVIFGGAGNDNVLGGFGDDVLFGVTGDDTMDGGAGDDRVFGGDGADTFVFAVGSGSDLVGDFTAGMDATASDTLQLDAALWAADGALTEAEVVSRFASINADTFVEFDFGNGDRFVLENVTSTDGLEAYLSVV